MIIFDLDGTLADVQHRRHLLPDWDAFFRACVFDTPCLEVINVFESLEVLYHLQIWSGRSDEVRVQTEDWIGQHIGGGYTVADGTLRMRPEGDHTPDDELKARWLNEVGVDKVEMVFDDSDKVVRMWREHGIRCFQVAPGDF